MQSLRQHNFRQLRPIHQPARQHHKMLRHEIRPPLTCWIPCKAKGIFSITIKVVECLRVIRNFVIPTRKEWQSGD